MILARAAKDNGAKRSDLVEPDLFFARKTVDHALLVILKKNDLLKILPNLMVNPSPLCFFTLLKESGVDTVLTVHNHSIKVQKLFSDIFNNDFHNLIPMRFIRIISVSRIWCKQVRWRQLVCVRLIKEQHPLWKWFTII